MLLLFYRENTGNSLQLHKQQDRVRDINVGVLFPRVMEFPLHITSLTHEILHYGAGSPVYTILQCKMKARTKTFMYTFLVIS